MSQPFVELCIQSSPLFAGHSASKTRGKIYDITLILTIESKVVRPLVAVLGQPSLFPGSASSRFANLGDMSAMKCDERDTQGAGLRLTHIQSKFEESIQKGRDLKTSILCLVSNIQVHAEIGGVKVPRALIVTWFSLLLRLNSASSRQTQLPKESSPSDINASSIYRMCARL